MYVKKESDIEPSIVLFLLQLRHEFRMIVGCKKTEDLLKDWPLWVKRVFAFAGVESRSRPTIKQLLLQHETTKDHFTNQDGKYHGGLITRLNRGGEGLD